MDSVNRQKLIYLMVWTATVLFILATLLIGDTKYGLVAVALAVLTHSEHEELRRRMEE